MSMSDSVSRPADLGLDRILARSLAAPFHRARDTAAGWVPGGPLSWVDWQRVRPMSKDELRGIGDIRREFFLGGPEQAVEYWRSGGVTGVPLFYPRTAADVEASLDAFARCLAEAGLTSDDVLYVSLPIGIHPAGQQVARAAERIGAAVVWGGAGNQTGTFEQIMQIRELGVTAWAGMPSYGMTLANRALEAGQPLAAGPVRLLITTAERMTDAKRDRLQALWGAPATDVFGMSELTLLGLECGVERGFHFWSDVAYCEVLDETTLRPVAEGEPGLLCVTPLTTGQATPFVRWLSGDVVTRYDRCGCRLAGHPRILHTGRLRNFFKVRGVNIGHDELEELLFRQDDVVDFRAVSRGNAQLLVDVEARDGHVGLAERLTERIDRAFGISPTVRVLGLGEIERLVAGQLKAQRFVDEEC